MLLIATLTASVALIAWLSPESLLVGLVSPGVLEVVTVALVGFGVTWAISIVATHLLLRPAVPTKWQRLFGAVFVGTLSLIVAVPTFLGSFVIHDTATLIEQTFDEGGETRSNADASFGNPVEPWSERRALNVLVLGSDAGPDRAGTRTDTVVLVSIDTRSGAMLLFSLPRQTQRMPFPAGSALARRWPRGFTSSLPNDAEYFLNAIYENVPALAPDDFRAGTRDPGAEAMKQAVSAALGLRVDYYVMVNMKGLVDVIDALGGIRVNINRPVPVGGRTTGDVPPDRWLPPGPDQHLDGVDALWFARGRYGSAAGESERMSRQRCLVLAAVKQANPTTVLTNFEGLMRASLNTVHTDIPRRQVPALLSLAFRAESVPMRTVLFENDRDGFSTLNPNWTVVRARVQAAINAKPLAQTSGARTPALEGATLAPAVKSSRTPTPPPSTVADECGYRPPELVPQAPRGAESSEVP